MAGSPTLVFVHAHPDDEVFFGSGAALAYAERGHRVVLVTCTNGRLGFDPDGRAGDDLAHDPLATVVTRAGELQRAAAALEMSRVISLGYDDSGMAEWPDHARPGTFARADVEAAARTLASILDEERAAVVITYDENGFYGHPDHVQANVVTRRALDFATSVSRLYYPVVPRSRLDAVREGAALLGLTLPAWVLEAEGAVDDSLVATTLDVSSYAATKQAAMAIHASQIDNDDLAAMDERLFALLFGVEFYQRAWSRESDVGDESDLFGGLSWD